MVTRGLKPLSARILLAEDSPVNQEVAAATLESFGCVVDIVGDGMAAVRSWQTGGYDLVLMDCLMPRMDGYEATTEIRRLEGKREHVPIIALSANSETKVRSRVLRAGMDDLLSKPFKTHEIYDLLNRWLS